MRWQASSLELLVNRLWSSGRGSLSSSPSVSATHWRSTSKRDSKTKLWLFSLLKGNWQGLNWLRLKLFFGKLPFVCFISQPVFCLGFSYIPHTCCDGGHSLVHIISCNCHIIHCLWCCSHCFFWGGGCQNWQNLLLEWKEWCQYSHVGNK